MALTVTLAAGAGSTSASAGRQLNFVATVTNPGAAALSLSALQILCKGGDARIGQPQYLTPNVPAGTGNPVIAAGASAAYAFQAVFDSPYGAGPSPNNAGGASPSSPIPDPFFCLQAQGQDSSGAVFSSTLFVPVLSTIAPFPLAQGGAFQFGQGFNFINGLVFGLL